MRSIIDVFVDRPIFASMIILLMVVVGGAAYTGLGVDRLPSVDLPTINVRTSLPGASPEEVEAQVSEVIEEVVNTIDGIEELRSISGPGTSFVLATFRLDRDIEAAAQDVRDKVATVLRRLPSGIDPPIVSKFDNDSSPVLTMALAGEGRTLRELSEIADKTIKPVLERSKGVGEVQIVGQAERTVNVFVDADRLAALGLPITAVRDGIARANSEVPGGNLTGALREQTLRTMGRLETAQDFADVIIAERGGAPIRVRDIGRVEDGTAEQRSVARLDGVPSVSLEVRRQSGANSIEVIEAVKVNVERARELLPPGVTLTIIRDQSAYIYAALNEINVHLVLGSILACLVVFMFTRSWRSVVIAGVAIPASVISTFAAMYVLDFTLNSVTMLALVLMVGIVIDDAIVVLENIFRFVEEKGMTPMEAARAGTKEIALAVLATTLSLAVIFVPVSFMSSVTGRFLFQFGITAAVAVMVSLVVSFVLTPTLSARMLRGKAHARGGGASRAGFYRYIDKGYEWMLRGTMRFRWAAAGVAVAVIAAGVPLYMATPKSFLPDGADEAEFEIRVETPQGTNFVAVNELMQQLEADLIAMPEVRTVLATAGGGFIGGVNQGSVYLRIAPHAERVFGFGRLWRGLMRGEPLEAFRGNYTQNDVMTKIRRTLGPRYRAMGVTLQVRGFSGFNLGGGNFDIDFSISGPDLEQLAAITEELARRGEKLGTIVGLDTTLELDKPEVRVRLDRDRASDLGVSASDIGTTLRLMVGGDEEITRFRDPLTNEDYDVRLRLEQGDRSRVEQVPALLLAAGDGRLIELQNVASVEETVAPSRVDRLDRSRDARVRGTLAPGAALADATSGLLREVNDMGLPAGYAVTVRGAGREFARTSGEFAFAFALSVLFMYMILASQYESLTDPVVILLSLPLSVPFALLSLWLTGTSLNLYSALGLLVLFGVVKKNAILQIDHMKHLQRQGMPRAQAIIEGNRDRLRPILMTTLTLVAGMLPLWMGTGPGAEERRAVAVVVIGGQSLALLITLLITPVAYSIVDDLAKWIALRRKVRTASGGRSSPSTAVGM
jgi:HAE1 family hydrophobic/amphiphilic exporter-1